MAHFAELDENNKVIQVLLVDDVIVNNEEQNGINFLQEHYGHSNWVQTWRGNGVENPRKLYAGKDYTYDSVKNAFIAPKPEGFNSFVFNEDTYIWEPPIPKPQEKGKMFYWDESTLSWIEETRTLPAIMIDENGDAIWR